MGDSRLSAVYFVHADLLQLYLHGVPDASTSVSVAVFNIVDEFPKCCIDSSDIAFFCFFRVFFALLYFWLLILLALLYFESST